MPEIDTCEKYVLNELFNEQDKNNKLQESLFDMRHNYNEMCNENTMLKIRIQNLEAELNELKGIKEEEK